MKIFLQYPWKFPDSPYYKYLVKYPPKEVKYVNVEKRELGVITSRKKFAFLNKLKLIIRRSINTLNFSLPNAHLTLAKHNYDLIHCAHCLSLNKRPWVADFEAAWQFWIGKPNQWSMNAVKKILLNKYCKKIMPWTYAAKKQILKYFPQKEIKKKVEVVYPAVPLLRVKKKKKDFIGILFIGRYFYSKGGLITLEVFLHLLKKYENIKCFFISPVPDKIKVRYTHKNLIFYNLIPQKELFNKIYPLCDIFVCPGFSDSFGFNFLEALSFGLPVITVNGFAREELLENGKTGYIIKINKKANYYKIGKNEIKIIIELINKTSTLIENKKLREKMSKECIKLIKKGKFSIKERNHKLKEIYEEALRK